MSDKCSITDCPTTKLDNADVIYCFARMLSSSLGSHRGGVLVETNHSLGELLTLTILDYQRVLGGGPTSNSQPTLGDQETAQNTEETEEGLNNAFNTLAVYDRSSDSTSEVAYDYPVSVKSPNQLGKFPSFPASFLLRLSTNVRN